MATKKKAKAKKKDVNNLRKKAITKSTAKSIAGVRARKAAPTEIKRSTPVVKPVKKVK